MEYRFPDAMHSSRTAVPEIDNVPKCLKRNVDIECGSDESRDPRVFDAAAIAQHHRSRGADGLPSPGFSQIVD